MYIYDHLLILHNYSGYACTSLDIFFYSLFFSFIFVLEISLSVCHTIQYLFWLTSVMNFDLLCSHVILSMSLLETFYHAFFWENINERYPEIFPDEMIQRYFRTFADLFYKRYRIPTGISGAIATD
jgi:hypothetical protein